MSTTKMTTVEKDQQRDEPNASRVAAGPEEPARAGPMGNRTRRGRRAASTPSTPSRAASTRRVENVSEEGGECLESGIHHPMNSSKHASRRSSRSRSRKKTRETRGRTSIIENSIRTLERQIKKENQKKRHAELTTKLQKLREENQSLPPIPDFSQPCPKGASCSKGICGKSHPAERGNQVCRFDKYCHFKNLGTCPFKHTNPLNERM